MAVTPRNFRGSEPAMPLRPHPRQLARVAGIASQLPVCPPTPTHHARKSRNKELRPPGLKSLEGGGESFEIVSSPEIKHADIVALDTLDGWASSHLEGGENACADVVGDGVHKAVSKPTWSLKVGNENSRLEIRTLGEIVNIDTRPPDVRSQELVRQSVDLRLHEVGECSRESEASGGIPIPLRHLASTRLPSIPERSPRIITLETEHEEPLPPCKFFFNIYLVFLWFQTGTNDTFRALKGLLLFQTGTIDTSTCLEENYSFTDIICWSKRELLTLLSALNGLLVPSVAPNWNY